MSLGGCDTLGKSGPDAVTFAGASEIPIDQKKDKSIHCLELLKWPLGPVLLVSDVLMRNTDSLAFQQALQGQNMHT